MAAEARFFALPAGLVGGFIVDFATSVTFPAHHLLGVVAHAPWRLGRASSTELGVLLGTFIGKIFKSP